MNPPSLMALAVVRVKVTMKTREVGEPKLSGRGALGLKGFFVYGRDEGRMVPSWQSQPEEMMSLALPSSKKQLLQCLSIQRRRALTSELVGEEDPTL